MSFLFLLRIVSQRTQILFYWSFPQLRSTENCVTISTTGHIEFQEGAFSASALEQHEVVPTMLDIVKWVLLAVQPKRWAIETRAPLKQGAVEAARGVAAGSHPSAHKID